MLPSSSWAAECFQFQNFYESQRQHDPCGFGEGIVCTFGGGKRGVTSAVAGTGKHRFDEKTQFKISRIKCLKLGCKVLIWKQRKWLFSKKAQQPGLAVHSCQKIARLFRCLFWGFFWNSSSGTYMWKLGSVVSGSSWAVGWELEDPAESKQAHSALSFQPKMLYCCCLVCLKRVAWDREQTFVVLCFIFVSESICNWGYSKKKLKKQH